MWRYNQLDRRGATGAETSISTQLMERSLRTKQQQKKEKKGNKITGVVGGGGSSIQYLRDTVRLRESIRPVSREWDAFVLVFFFPLACLFVCGEEIS